MGKKIKQLEDLATWREAIKLTILVYKYTTKLPEYEKYNIKKHIEGNARNIPGNIAEGFGRFYYKESKQFYRIANGSLEELRSDVFLYYSLKYFDKEVFGTINNQIKMVGRLLNGLINPVRYVKVQR